MAAGRPPLPFDPNLGDEICERIIMGESLIHICKDYGKPALSTIYKWLTLNKDFAEQYARARDLQADTFLDQISEISHDGSKDWIMTKTGPVCDNEHVQRSRLRVDALKWQMSKLAPKKYADRLDLNHSGKIETTLTPEEREARIAELSRKYADGSGED